MVQITDCCQAFKVPHLDVLGMSVYYAKRHLFLGVKDVGYETETEAAFQCNWAEQ